ncbi:TVP38/TMEM64 family protein [Rufibacter roseus]|uniref:TVP38/TMEM64 family protein n=1 Tax=Rufibacter roseus TaxID=1567108 RepID=A0ABW2DQF9_9BACT|nr:VTT domain-containing protein [Rufibacter roseus]
MKRLVFTFIFCCLLIISAFLLFGGVESFVEEKLGDTQSVLMYTAFSSFFLTFDVVLPVPSSLIMILNGKVLGFLPGMLLSLGAGLCSSCLGFIIGRKASPYLNKLFTQKEREMSDHLFRRFGDTAIAISKAIPILSEAVSVVSGTTSVAFSSFFLYSFIGHTVISLLYSYVGSYASTLDTNLMAGTVILFALFLSWFIQLLVKKGSPLPRNA